MFIDVVIISVKVHNNKHSIDETESANIDLMFIIMYVSIVNNRIYERYEKEKTRLQPADPR